MQPRDQTALRQAVLAVCVLDDVDLVPGEDAVTLAGPRACDVTWAELHAALAGADPATEVGRIRVRQWILGRRIADATSAEQLRMLARPVGLPVSHALHPGERWVRHRVPGGALHLGFGFASVGTDPDEVVIIPPSALEAAGVDPVPWWPVALAYLERMGTLAAERVKHSAVLRPMGDCDVVTLLGATSLRRAVCAADPTHMRPAAVPMRRRGWLDPSRIDPAFTVAAAAITFPADRGFDRPVLLTADEVAVAPAGGRPAEIVLRDPAVSTRR